MRRLARLTGHFAAAMLAAVVLAGIALLLWSRWESAEAISARLQSLRLFLDAGRLALLALFVTAWGPLMAWRGRAYGLSEVRITELKAQRWKVAVVILAVELVLVQNLLGKIGGWLS